MTTPQAVEPPPRSLAAAASAAYGTHIAAAALSLVNVLLVARTLGPDGRGAVAFLVTVAFISAWLSTIGVEEANVNLAGLEPRLRAALATNSVALSILLGGAAAAVVATLMAFVPAVAAESEPLHRGIAIASIPVVVLGVFLGALAQAEYRFAIFNWYWVLPSAGQVVVNGTLALAGDLTVGRAVGAWVASQSLATLVVAAYVARRLGGFGRPDLRLARRCLGFGAKSHPVRVMTLANARLDQWFVGAFSGPRELGLYSVAVAWAETLTFLPSVLALVQRPDLVRASARAAAEQVAVLVRVGLVTTAAVAAAMALAAPLLCVTVFGSDFRGSVDDLRILAAGGVGFLVLRLLANALVAQNLPVLATAAVAVAFAATLVLDLALIPAYGGVGAATATAVAYSVGALAAAAIFSRSLGGPARDLVPRGTEPLELWRLWRSRTLESTR